MEQLDICWPLLLKKKIIQIIFSALQSKTRKASATASKPTPPFFGGDMPQLLLQLFLIFFQTLSEKKKKNYMNLYGNIRCLCFDMFVKIGHILITI